MHLGIVFQTVLAEWGRALSAAHRYEALRYTQTSRGDIARRVFEEFYTRQGTAEHAALAARTLVDRGVEAAAAGRPARRRAPARAR